MTVGWIDLETAAKRSGRSAGHLARICRDKWAGEQLAEQRPPVGGGKPTWFIKAEADAAFAAVKFPQQLGTDLRHVPAAKREEAHRRLQIIQKWEKAVAAGFTLGYDKARTTGHFLQQMLIDSSVELSRATLYNWHKSYRAEGVAGLVDGRGKADEQPAAADPFLEEVKRLYLSLRKPKLTVCHEIAALKATEQAWSVRSYKACQRMIDALPRQVVLKYRFGDEAYKNEAEPFIERDYASLSSNEAWNADHHQFDVIVNAGTRTEPRLVRPWLTAFQDMRSRKIVGWKIFAHDPNSDTILTAFRWAVMDHGVPEVLFIDNGKDFDSYALNGRTKKDRWAQRRVRVELDQQRTAGLFAELQIDVRHVWPYHGQSKPIERFFGTLEQRTVVWDTYCGNSPAEKPEDLQLQLERGNAPMLADFIAWFEQWLTAYHAGHAHSGDGMDGKTPDQVYAENLDTRRTASRELLDLLCLKKTKPVRVVQNGVACGGIRYGQYDLSQMIGTEVVLRVDERDATRVQVYTLDDRFVCLASANRKLPVTADAQAVRDAVAEKKQDRKRLKEYVDRRPRMADDLPDRIVRAAAARARAVADESANEPPPPGPSLQPVRHALEDQLPALRRALDRTSNTGRVAVGAESLSLANVSRLMQQQEEGTTGDDGGDAFAKLGMKFRGNAEE